MDPDWFVFLVTLPVPISLAVFMSLLVSCFLIWKRHTTAGIIAGLVTGPTIIFLLLLALYFYVALQIQEMDRVMPHAPERDTYYQGWAMLLAGAVGFAIFDSVVAFGLSLLMSLAYLAYRAIGSTNRGKPARQDR